jgi:hypothetical protein
MKKLMVLVVVIFLAACGPRLDENGQMAKQYLQDQGYSIKSFEGNATYTFERENLTDMPDIAYWRVQSVEPDAYIGKEIIQEIFIVKDHPLSEIYGPQPGFSEKVEVRVYIHDGEIIGGISFPSSEGLAGSPYSLDGKTAEEMIGDYAAWQEKWVEKYGE